MKKLLYVLIVVLAVLIQIQTSNAATKEVKEWTFLTFMNGHDSVLTAETDANLNLMKRVGSTEDINIVAQVASVSRPNTERVYVEKGNVKVIETLSGRVDMGDYQELNNFIDWAIENYPAKKYFINVWNHGMGWHELQKLRTRSNAGNIQIQDVSIDSYTGNLITTEQMGQVMKRFAQITGNRVELYGNDACVMAMIEIAAEFSDSVSYYASSQENEPAAGWPYDKFLARWAQKPHMNGAEVGKILAEEYLKAYPDEFSNPMGTTFSVIDVSELEGLMDALSNLRNELVGLGSEKQASLFALASSTHNFDGGNDYKDLMDFVLKLEKHGSLNINKSILSDVKSAYSHVVLKNVTNEAEEGAHGLSVWLPTYGQYYDQHITRYKNLSFNKKTGWSDLLENFFK